MSLLPSTAVTAETRSPVLAVEPGPPDRDVPSTAAVESATPVTVPAPDGAPGVVTEVPRTTTAAPPAPTPPQETKRVTSESRYVSPDARRVTLEAKRATPEAKRVTPEPQLVTLA